MGERLDRDPYRVFISYSHDDREIAEVVEKHLREGLKEIPMWDPMVLPGATFSDELREMISFAHVFVPILTPGSNQRPWVHQEVGYAIALGTPILPLAFGALPPGMADRLQAVRVCDSAGHSADGWARLLNAKLTRGHLEAAVSLHQGAQTSLPVLCAPQPEDRTVMLIEHLVAVFKHNTATPKGVRIRHEAPYGTLSLPNSPASELIWRCRDGDYPRSDWLRTHFRRERRWTELHATCGGLSLIVHPDRLPKTNTRRARMLHCSLRARLRTLVRFLESMPDELCQVVVSDEPYAANTLIAGDWFVADTVTPSRGRGFRQTIVTRHAPTVSERVEQFDADLLAMLEAKGIPPEESRQKAVERLNELLSEVPPPVCRYRPDEPCPLVD